MRRRTRRGCFKTNKRRRGVLVGSRILDVSCQRGRGRGGPFYETRDSPTFVRTIARARGARDADDGFGVKRSLQFYLGHARGSSRADRGARPLGTRGAAMIHFALLFSRQGKVRLSKYYKPYSQKERAKLVKEVTSQILARPNKLCNVVEHRNLKLIYKRYASLYFMLAVDDEENELIVLEMIQHYVEILDRYFGNVCELDLIFNFHKAYFILDEVLVAGELQETSKKLIARLVAEQDALVEAAKLGTVEQDGTPLQSP